MRKIAFLMAALFCLVSCISEGPRYNVSEMVSIDGSKITNDAGIRYRITNINKVSEMLKHERAYVIGQASSPDEAGDYDYDLNVDACFSVNVKDAVAASASEEGYGKSPVSVQSAWLANSYFNMLLAVSYEKATGYKGEMNLVFDDVKSTTSDLYFKIQNKQEGKTWEDETLTAADIEFGQEYFSFRYLDLLPEGTKGNVTVHISWVWFDNNNYDPDAKIPLHSVSEKSDTCEIYLQ